MPSCKPVSSRARVVSFKKSTANQTPSPSRPGRSRSRGLAAPQQSTTASKSRRSSRALMSLPTSTPVRNSTPWAAIRSSRRWTMDFSSFMLGMPYISRPPGRSSRSNTVTEWPRRLSWSAQARPEGPEPTTAIRLPVRFLGGRGFMSPRSQASSMMPSSLSLTVTGSPWRPQVQAASHRAGHTLPVNSGKLLVFSSRSRAWWKLPW